MNLLEQGNLVEAAMHNTPLVRTREGVFGNPLPAMVGVDKMTMAGLWRGELTAAPGVLRKLQTLAGPHGRTFSTLYAKQHELEIIKWGV